MALYPGQKVEFIGKGNYGHYKRKVQVPGRNIMYTVRDVFTHETQPGVVGIHLIEVRNPPEPFAWDYHPAIAGAEVGWRADEFRPIVERKTDISVFERMLKPEKVDA